MPQQYLSDDSMEAILLLPLLENEKSLRESEINNGAKIMLVGTTDFRVAEGLTKLWTYTKYGDLTACNLKDIPEELWPCAPFLVILDISYNSLQHVPHRIDCFTELRKLFLKKNDLSDESISWRGLTSLKLLQVLSLSQNCLNTLPPTLGLLTSLRRLDVANKKLTALPIEIGNLTKLEDLQVNNNRISSIPSSIGNCTSLIEVDLSSNHLSELPDEFCSLHNLKDVRPAINFGYTKVVFYDSVKDGKILRSAVMQSVSGEERNILILLNLMNWLILYSVIFCGIEMAVLQVEMKNLAFPFRTKEHNI
ncbi:hypothetical protein Pint_32488 [Pistacia integerrima]|uniref:Uncharacterized protein n=1 Tax=Pistacia integerrima TaxID=434235 RepID=A0ACC0XQ24_9ROSI|nr:hypothetical protein Pint_32488 [Pistacia integerrima]